MEAKKGNDGKNKAISTDDMTSMLLKVSGKPTAFKHERANTRRALICYRDWGYLKHLKDDRWIFDWRNHENTKLMRFYKKHNIKNKDIQNRIDWKMQELLEKAVELKWPFNPNYKLEI